MTTPIRESILANLQSTLAGITVAGGYNNTVLSVVRGEMTPTHFQTFPVILYDDISESYSRLNNNLLSRSLQLGVMGILKLTKGTLNSAARTVASSLLADIEVALMADPCRGDFAIDTLLLSNRIESTEAEPYVFVLVECQVNWRSNRTDPTTKV